LLPNICNPRHSISKIIDLTNPSFNAWHLNIFCK
jgi:hypothetical protein